MKKVFITTAVLLTGLVFSQTKKKDSLLSKNKTSSAKESKGFYKNVDSVSASKYKILNSVPKEQNKYKILKKKKSQLINLFLHHKRDYCLSLKKRK